MTVKKTILCVDDEHSLSIQRLTLETRGYRVLACSTAVDAIHALTRSNVDLVMSTLDLPDSTPGELVTQLKALSPQMPVILLCDRRRIYNTSAPADLFISKDAHAATELLDGIRQLLTKRRGPRRAMAAAVAERARAS